MGQTSILVLHVWHQDMLGQNMSSQGLGSCAPTALLFAPHMATLVGSAHCCCFPQQVFHYLGRGSWSLHCSFGFIFTAPHILVMGCLQVVKP
jgi:hypothetical protein